MKLVIFGLTISSSWGNGHATLLRGLFRALVRRGHFIQFFEKDVPYYAAHRDYVEMHGVHLCLYSDWDEIESAAREALSDADVAMVTSYCPDGIAATNMVRDANRPLKVFYDLDTPVTLETYKKGESLSYIGPRLLRDFDLVLSYTGGAALEELRTVFGAKLVAPLYGSVDVDVHRRVDALDLYRSDLSYLGTYAEDRQDALNRLFVEPASLSPERRFLIGGSKYPVEFPWTSNMFYVLHVPPPAHPAFYSSSRITLNITRRAMAEMGYCPSGRLFEAAACGVPILSDYWEGMELFFAPGSEILIGRDADDTVNALSMSGAELERIAAAAFERTMTEHTADRRATELEAAFDMATSFNPPATTPTTAELETVGRG